MTIRHCILSTFLFVLSISTVFGADWPQWRGPERDGVSKETGLLGQWPESGPKLAWKATGFGVGYSGVAISGDRIYAMGDEGSDCYAIACKLSDGQRVWRTKVGKAGAPGWGGYAGPRVTPTVDGEMVYVIGQYGELVCLKAADGAKVWSKHLVSDFGGKLPEWGYSESVLVDGDKVLCTPGGSQGAIIALNKTTGQTLWQTKDFQDAAHYSSLVLCEIGGVRQYVQLTAASVVGVGVDGKVLWRADRKGRTAVIPTPIVKGKNVYVTSGYGVGSNLFEIQQADGAFTAKEVYANKSIANQHGGAVLAGDYVYGYCDAKGWVCQQFDTGDIKWSEKGKAGKGSLTYADGRLYLRCENDGIVALIEATPDGYKETGRFVQPGFGKPQTWPHPVISGKKLYLRDQDQLLCYDISK